jgi:hypothetical protein
VRALYNDGAGVIVRRHAFPTGTANVDDDTIALRTPASVVLAAASSWLVTCGLCVAIAVLTGVELQSVRTLMPFLAWLLLAPLVALWARSHPPIDRRNLLVHLASFPLALVLLQVTFRLLYFVLTGTLELPQMTLSYLLTATWVAALLYAGTVWPVAALSNLRRARQTELLQAEIEAEAVSGHLDLSLSRLGPHELDALLGRVRGVVATSPARADEALDALGRYLRLALRGVEAGTWTLRRELEMLGPFLELESACSGRAVELTPHRLADARLDRPLRQHAVVGVVAGVLPRSPRPARLALAAEDGRLELSGEARGGGDRRAVEVGW